MNTMNNIRHSVAQGDEIWLTIVCNGTMVANVCHRHFASMDEVLGFAYAMRRPMGLSQLTIRNRTQGWSTMRSIATCRRAS